MTWEPKAAFAAVTECYRTRPRHADHTTADEQ
jgi:hypothetical protein